jgi:adenosylhomocysteinase
MDMSFANQALSVKYLKEQAISLENQVYKVPDDIDMNVAGLKISSLYVKIEELTPRQKKYLASWEEGT